MVVFSLSVSAQDFASRFMASHKHDANVSCITISPTMMNKILKIDAVEKDEKMSDVISNLKSMQLLTSEVRPLHYYHEALKVLDQNSDRFEPYLSSKDKSEQCKILTRKHKGVIVEMVMLTYTKYRFSVINFTGNMDDEFITSLAGAMKQRHS
jgi:hypothetical protein